MTTLKIKESAIAHNVQEIRKRTSKRIIAVVKEDGYGLGLRNEYAILRRCGIDFYAVATPWEALQLSNLTDQEDILMLAPEYSVEACAELLTRGVTFMLGDSRQAEVLRQAGARAECTPRVHLAIDTGLGRYGYSWDDLNSVREDLKGLEMTGCYTHFATQSRAYIKNIHRQFGRYQQALQSLRSMGVDPGMTHACASRAFSGVGDLGCDAIRVGSLLLGRCAGPLASYFEDAVYLESIVYQQRLHQRGETVGYDGNQRLKRDTMVGLVRVGYADGAFIGCRDGSDSLLCQLMRCMVHRMRGQRAQRQVHIQDRIVPVIGKIGMNHMLLDLTDVHCEVGEPVRIDISPILVRREIPRLMMGMGTKEGRP